MDELTMLQQFVAIDKGNYLDHELPVYNRHLLWYMNQLIDQI